MVQLGSVSAQPLYLTLGISFGNLLGTFLDLELLLGTLKLVIRKICNLVIRDSFGWGICNLDFHA